MRIPIIKLESPRSGHVSTTLTKGENLMAVTTKRRRRAVRRNLVTHATLKRKNPTRRRSVPKSARKRRITAYKGKSGWYAAKRPARRGRSGPKPGTRLNPRHRRSISQARITRVNRRGRTRQNPAFRMPKLINQKFLMQSLTLGGGFTVGVLGIPVVYKISPQFIKDRREWLGLVHVGLGMLLVVMVKNKMVKSLGAALGAVGVYDLISQNIPDLNLPRLSTSNAMIDGLLPGGNEKVSGALNIRHQMNASYETGIVPVSPVSQMAASYEAPYQRTGELSTMGASYPMPGAQTEGLGMDYSEGVGSIYSEMGCY